MKFSSKTSIDTDVPEPDSGIVSMFFKEYTKGKNSGDKLSIKKKGIVIALFRPIVSYLRGPISCQSILP